MEHPITPPPGLVEQWRDEALNSFPDDEYPCPCDIDDARDEHIAIQAARWGADQELEACCEWILEMGLATAGNMEFLRDIRRPKPPSLKEQALEALEQVDAWGVQSVSHLTIHDDLIAGVDVIRRALESIPDSL